jgi:hypothetical protein
MAKTTQENTTNRFTKNEYVAYKLQIWRDTFNVCLNASGGRDVAMATKSAADAVSAFEKQFSTDVDGAGAR